MCLHQYAAAMREVIWGMSVSGISWLPPSLRDRYQPRLHVEYLVRMNLDTSFLDTTRPSCASKHSQRSGGATAEVLLLAHDREVVYASSWKCDGAMWRWTIYKSDEVWRIFDLN